MGKKSFNGKEKTNENEKNKNSVEKNKAEDTQETENAVNNEMNGDSKKTEEDSSKEKTEEKNEEKNEEKTQSDKDKEIKNAEDENLLNKLLRLQADFLNYKTRTEKDKIATYGNAVADVITDLLPVIDNLERALESSLPNESAFKEGIQMVYSQFTGLLNKRGLEEIDALHKPFDPNLHFGVAFDSDSDKEDGTVIEVFQKGYTVNNKVIRPAMVKICKK